MSQTAAKRVFIKTYGCQMNVYDSDRMADALCAARLCRRPTTSDDADLIVLNTCHIREKAAEKVYSELGRLKRTARRAARQTGRSMMIGVAGCVAQAEGEEIIARAPAVDLVFGPQSYHRLPELVARAATAPVVDTDFPKRTSSTTCRRRNRETTHCARADRVSDRAGRLRQVLHLLRRALYARRRSLPAGCAGRWPRRARLVAAGVREITLLGQNVNAYHGAGRQRRNASGLAALLRRLAEIEGLDRLRYTTSHPRDMDDDLIAAHRDLATADALSAPAGAVGLRPILKAMNRRHTRADYLDLIDRIRAARPDIALSGDFIVGFPGETEADFEDDDAASSTTVGYASAFSFKYSPRPGTPGAELPDQVPEPVKFERLAALQDLIAEQQAAFNAGLRRPHPAGPVRQAGPQAGPARRPLALSAGRCMSMAPVCLIGTIQPVEIARARQKFTSWQDCHSRSSAESATQLSMSCDVSARSARKVSRAGQSLTKHIVDPAPTPPSSHRS